MSSRRLPTGKPNRRHGHRPSSVKTESDPNRTVKTDSEPNRASGTNLFENRVFRSRGSNVGGP
ncbi:hypothetical protein D8S78_13085 [Natrialba swarupiae]|nr:hypothetical protein [Natrialba swarupiae]